MNSLQEKGWGAEDFSAVRHNSARFAVRFAESLEVPRPLFSVRVRLNSNQMTMIQVPRPPNWLLVTSERHSGLFDSIGEADQSVDKVAASLRGSIEGGVKKASNSLEAVLGVPMKEHKFTKAIEALDKEISATWHKHLRTSTEELNQNYA